MNRFLARTLSFFNGAIALLLIAIGGAFGLSSTIGGAGLVVGLMGGVVVAAFACGAIAYLALIERHLAVLAGAGEPARSDQGRPHERLAGQRDPKLY